MKSTLIVITIFGLLHFVSALWPQPSSILVNTNSYQLTPSSFTFQVSGGDSQLLQRAFKRYSGLIFYQARRRQSSQDLPPLQKIIVKVNDWSENLQFGIDESYTLNVTAPTGLITAHTVFGALHALESFSQLVSNQNGAYVVTQTYIEDAPRFQHRGFLIDTSRHWLPVSTIKRAIDALSYAKMNVLHWHAVDAQSFPIESKAFPRLSLGAWSPDEVYSTQDIQDIVQYAKDRGLRVIPEFDVPGHSYSWGKGYPITVGCPDWSANVNNVPLDPTNDLTYQVLQGFIGEMSKLFIDNFWHTGGDEVVTGCFLDNSTITNWMKQHGLTKADQLIQLFEGKLQTIIKANGKTFVGWQELFDSYGLQLPQGTIIEVWKDEQTLFSVANGGFQTILAYGWYLDHLQDDWTVFYENEPFSQNENWTPATEKMVIGGEVCNWGEQVSWANFDQIVWPRTAAAAERLWSPKWMTNTAAALPRLLNFVCTLNRRGIASTPLQPGPSCFPSA